MDIKMFLKILLSAVCLKTSYSWSYSGDTGPAFWASRGYPNCHGSKQSPIDIPADTVFDSSLTDLHFHGYEELGIDDLTIKHNGFEVMWHLNRASIGKAYFTGGGYDGKYLFSQINFGWGKDDVDGSGHTFQGRRYPLEMQMIHFKEEYGSTQLAQAHSDGLAVLISDTPNADLEPFFNALARVPHKGNTTALKFATGFYSIMKIDKTKYYRYNGSMPLPPCNEVCIWTLFSETNSVSSEQLGKFRQLYRQYTTEHILTNHRPTQPLGSRVVKVSFSVCQQVQKLLLVWRRFGRRTNVYNDLFLRICPYTTMYAMPLLYVCGSKDYSAYLDIVKSWGVVGTGLIWTAKTGLAFCFSYHLCGGIRHLVWDLAVGLDKEMVNTSGIILLAMTVLLTGVFVLFM